MANPPSRVLSYHPLGLFRYPFSLVASQKCFEGLKCEGRPNKECIVRTEKLVQQSIANYLHKKEENTIRSSCPDLTKACFMEFIQFFSNCPVGYAAAVYLGGCFLCYFLCIFISKTWMIFPWWDHIILEMG